MAVTAKEPRLSEVMVLAAAQEIHDEDVVFVGIGLPNLAANLAQRTHAPAIQMVYESGVYGARPSRLPISIGDPCLVTGAVQVLPMIEIFQYFLQQGLIDVGFLGAAQIDRFGNLNTTVIGADYKEPEVRLPGAGGATEIAWLAKRTVVILPQKKQKFPECLDFRTSVGYHEGGSSRDTLGASSGGPARVITDLGVYGFDFKSREIVLEKLHPGVSISEVQSEVGWPIKIKESLGITEHPNKEVLEILRNELDPQGHYLG